MSHARKVVCLPLKQGKTAVRRTFLCEHCGKIFQHTRNMRIHLRTHSVNRPRYPCKICRKTFLARNFLKEHENVHLDVKPYECNKCCKKFYGRANLRQHVRIHREHNFVCYHCSRSFTRKVTLLLHIKKFHLEQEQQNIPAAEVVREKAVEVDKTSFKCSRCKLTFDNEASLKDHRSVHVDIASCKQCGKTFSHHGSLTYHRRVAHSHDLPFQCDSCDRRYAAKSALATHIHRSHTKARIFVCPQGGCGRGFHSAGALRSHQTRHSGQASFTCEHCGKAFRRNNALTVHLKIHLEEKKFECSVCRTRFRQKANRVRHEKGHESKKKPFYCTFCGESFSRKSEYAQHALCKSKLLSSKKMNLLDQAEEMFDEMVEQIYS